MIQIIGSLVMGFLAAAMFWVTVSLGGRASQRPRARHPLTTPPRG